VYGISSQVASNAESMLKSEKYRFEFELENGCKIINCPVFQNFGFIIVQFIPSLIALFQ
jgi:hypothetical protein